MSGEALYERYKDALKRGHVASLRGRLEEALTAYAEAAAIAPERATPHTSAGTALLRRKRPADALRHFAVALTLAPRDEAALLGRAQALATLGRRREAADAFDAVAEVRASAGKLADAVDAARRALELAEGRDRRRALERLIEQLRASEPGEPGRDTLAQALLVLEGPAVVERPSTATGAEPAAKDTSAAAEDASPAADAGGPGVEGAGEAPEAGSAAAEAEEPADGADRDTAPVAPRAVLDRDLADDLDIDALAKAVEDGLELGTSESIDRVLDLATAYLRDGQVDAALDACYRALSLDPDGVALHLAIVELYDGRGWTALASEKLDLLGRLAGLDEDPDALGLVETARAGRG